MTDFLDDKIKEIQSRLRELKPLVDEYHRLESAAAALSGMDGDAGTATGASSGRRARGRRRAASGNGRRGGRRRGGSTRAQETLELVRARPGVSIPELAEAMGIKPNYLYRILPSLEQEGEVRREDRGWHATGSPASDEEAPA